MHSSRAIVNSLFVFVFQRDPVRGIIPDNLRKPVISYLQPARRRARVKRNSARRCIFLP